MATKAKKVKGMTPGELAIAYPDIMVDLETLDTKADCVILSIGAVRFNKNDIHDDGFYRAITIKSNQDMGRKISADTLTWWMSQSKEAQAVFTDPEAVHLEQAMLDFKEWIGSANKDVRIWSNGADFDIPVISHVYGQLDMSPPWNFYNSRCFRTMKSLETTRKVPKPANELAHNALADAYAQAAHLIEIWKVVK